MLDCSITSLCHVTKSTGAMCFEKTWSAPVGAGIALTSAPQLWHMPLERSLMQRASGGLQQL